MKCSDEIINGKHSSRLIAVAAGGRNEETYSKYAEGIRKRKYPSRRQQQQFFGVESWGSLGENGRASQELKSKM